jgi:hypothetical protein
MRDEMIVAGAPLAYYQCPWGDYIAGTKEQLQALGLAIGRAFPGEPGGPGKGAPLKTLDRYGCKIEIVGRKLDWSRGDLFTAARYFPNWPERPSLDAKQPFAPGVRRRMCAWWDEYFGTGPDLVAAGVLSVEHVLALGASGRRRLAVYGDGTLQNGPIASSSRSKEPGSRRIRQTTGDTLAVQVMLSLEEHDTRAAADKRAEREWEDRVRRLPRPARLTSLSDRLLTGRQTAEAEAARDIGFQGMLTKLVANAGAGDHG